MAMLERSAYHVIKKPKAITTLWKDGQAIRRFYIPVIIGNRIMNVANITKIYGKMNLRSFGI